MKIVLSSLTLAFMASQTVAFSATHFGARTAPSTFLMAEDGAADSAAEAPAAEEPASTVMVAEKTPAVDEPTSGVWLADDGSALLELNTLAKEQNPLLSYYDPLQLATKNFWDTSDKATIGFLRHAEIKHGRVAMAAFVGYWVQSNWHFPWKMSLDGSDFPSTDLSPEAQWDAIPSAAKWQIILFVGFLELWDELGGGIESSVGREDGDPGLPHYMDGRMPGKYPSFEQFRDTIHFVPELVDPFGFMKRLSEEKKAKGRTAEINNGRLAMIGIMGFLAADRVEGSVPLLNSIAQPYDGNVMIPFGADFSIFGSFDG